MALPLESPKPGTPGRSAKGGGRAREGSRTGTGRTGSPQSWADPPSEAAGRLDAFDRSLRARQRLALVLRLLGRLDGKRCLLLTPAEDESALAFHLRASGGCWVWATTRSEAATPMREVLGENVHVTGPAATPFGTGSFDRVVVTDVHAILHQGSALGSELARLLVPGGLSVLTAPHRRPSIGLPGGWMARDRRNGPRPSAVRAEEMALPLVEAGLAPIATGSCSRAFTQLVDRTPGLSGRPARLLAALDHLLPASGGFDVALSVWKEPAETADPADGGDGDDGDVGRSA